MPAEPGARAKEIDDQLLHAALRLFAAFGYDGTSVDMIADAAGRDHAAVVAAGGKTALYRAAMENYRNEMQNLIDKLPDRPVHDPAENHELLDLMIDFHFEHPEFNSLWVQRWLSDAFDIADVEQTYRNPVLEYGFRRFAAITKAEKEDLEMSVSLIDWAIHGFFTEGVQRLGSRPLRADDPDVRHRFRVYMHRLLDWLIQDG
jgi:AcrR family transcriptional regulator